MPSNPVSIEFELQPTLKGELLHLRPLRADDFEILLEASSDPLIWEQHPDPLRWRRDIFQNYFDSAMKSGGAFLITDAKTGQALGSSRFYDFHPENNGDIVIGYTFLIRACWGGTHNAELKKLMLGHAFQFVSKVYFHVGQENLRSQMALKKIGATLCGSTAKDFIFELLKNS